MKLLVANRGEIAVRVIRTAREMGIPTVAVYSTADAATLAVRLADEAVCIGPPAPGASYLNVVNVIGAAEITGCTAVHPGYGFLSENPVFAEECAANDIYFVGPPPDVMRRMGDKVQAKRAAKEAGLPVLEGSDGPVEDVGAATEAAERAGFPVLLKAAAGGGGRGMRRVDRAEELADAFGVAQQEAIASFGHGGIYVERLLEGARHIEVQVMADGLGGVLIAGDRECSIQRRHQKLIEEAPAPNLPEETRESMHAACAAACIAWGYRSAGTLEFLVDDAGNFFFLELNARLQVEHPVTELVTGLDLVEEQLRVADGKLLSVTGRAEVRGAAIECRVNAEDPSHGFRPAAGRLEGFVMAQGPGVRVDTYCIPGATIPPYYDSLIAKLCVWAPDRDKAINRMARALEESVIDGVATTIPLLGEIMLEARFRAGRYTTAYLDDAKAELPALGTG
ncbi:MAG: acetyl-CoA carboxylase biotin carboxylase subunit [Thermoleophilia bacterium]|nr:acetyl-CoA carboxylase biotin carboxylase subunit [Thermoleophilia bacterium]MDH3724262.1 acetyl-CoA carboxylase biotin carboxylase subunit [Thermoleophilia bacterium]